MPLRVIFFGTPAFAAASLRAIAGSSHTVTGVVTQPDRARGRGHKVRFEATKQFALDHGLPLWQPERIRDGGFLDQMRSLNADIAVVAAYGKLLPQVLLDLPRLGFVNVHASLLPRWRGAAPIHRAIIAGDPTTGITIMRVVLALDAGPMLSHVSTPIDPDETSAALEARLAVMGGDLLIRTLDRIERGDVTDAPQDESFVTYAQKLERADSVIDWSRPAVEIHNRIRGLQPWPLASTTIGGKRVLLLRSAVAADAAGSTVPGTVLEARGEALVVAAGSGAVRLIDVQPEGKRVMNVRDFLNGSPLRPGDPFQ